MLLGAGNHQIADSTIYNNKTTNAVKAGGIATGTGTSTLKNVAISSNTASGNGGGLYLWDNNLSVQNTFLEPERLPRTYRTTGGSTRALALEPGSVAMGAVPYADAGSGVWNGAQTSGGRYYDQRGVETVEYLSVSIGAYSDPPTPVEPTVTTTAASSVTTTTASSGGNATGDGGAAVTARGVCWNTTGSPTISDTKTSDGAGTGAFTCALTGLWANTIYYVRAYAVNSEGTNYVNQVDFATQDDNDGVDPAIEDDVPGPGGGYGDGNGDGSPDKNQPNVTSLETHDDSGYVTFDSTATDGTILQNVSAFSPSTVGAPSDVHMPRGVFSFEIHGVSAGPDRDHEYVHSEGHLGNRLLR